MKLTKTELTAALKAEREQLIELVSKASDTQLSQPSLCAGWSNKNVLGHIIGFELSGFDAFLLLFRLKTLDDINERQAQKYGNVSKETYIRLLKRGLKRSLLLIRLAPNALLNKKFIPVPNGRLSLAQLFGDLAMDRAIHYLDIAAPLHIASTVTDKAAMNVAIKFILACIDLLNPKIPQKFYGQIIELKLTGLCGGTYYWKIGSDEVTKTTNSKQSIALSAEGNTNDFLFTVSVRPSLLRKPIVTSGDQELENIMKNSFNANALWEH